MPDREITWRDKLRYRFENTLSKGTIAIIGWLALLSTAIVVLASLILAAMRVGQDPGDHEHPYGFFEGMWQSMLRTMDPGVIAGDSGWQLRSLMMVVTIGGIFIVSILIGTITSGLEARLAELRKGRSRVIEEGFTLILGWSSKVYSIIGELLIANENQKDPCIVILAERDKIEMEDDIRGKFASTKNTRVICRSGNPLDLDDLAVVDPHSARSIIVLAPEGVENPDIHVIKSVLAVTNNPDRKKEPYHIVAEIREPRNLEAAALVGGSEAIYIQGEDLIARVTAQTCRQSGLSVVYTELLDFDGAEIYFKAEPALAGRTYREVIAAYEDSTVMGILSHDGACLINPPMDTAFGSGDQVIAIAEDDDTLVLRADAGGGLPDVSALSNRERLPSAPERILILGWNGKAQAIIEELDNYVAPGSETIVICRQDGVRDTLVSVAKRMKRQKVRFADGDITHSATLAAVKAATFEHVILLSYNDLAIQEADAKTLITLLHLRNLADAAGTRLSIVSEMMDIRNRALAQIARADDFIVSDKLASLMMSQLSENKNLDKVFRVLFSSEGSEIYIRPMTDYIKLGSTVDFYTVLEAAAQKGETAIGYRLMKYADDKTRGYGVNVNPKKSEKHTFGENDKIVVLAED
ncbi:MAG: potassium transporter TrkA [Steroidobacteraceae bacterium]|jgi:voltage-gated potassium channel Kch|nr:potassium transporter TrkA [Steroidobacteraceae bacterium]